MHIFLDLLYNFDVLLILIFLNGDLRNKKNISKYTLCETQITRWEWMKYNLFSYSSSWALQWPGLWRSAQSWEKEATATTGTEASAGKRI